MLSIVIVSFNARPELTACLDSLAGARLQLDHEIVVVDNASTDGSMEAARAAGARVIALDRNVGFAAANNAAIRVSRGDLLLLLNSDTMVAGSAIEKLVWRLQATGATVAGPRLVDATGRVEISFGRMMSPLAELRQKAIGRLYDRHVGAVERRVAQWTRHEHWVDWVSGACLLVRRADAEAAGLLDERYFLYTEDVDFCHAIRMRGGRVLFTPAAEIVHLRGRSRASQPEASRAMYRRSHLAFYEKHHPRWAVVLKWYLTLKGET
jgi:N-acetylglucosaminyl-diphospho-decaprenol L-rhamnosyltransferase